MQLQRLALQAVSSTLLRTPHARCCDAQIVRPLALHLLSSEPTGVTLRCPFLLLLLVPPCSRFALLSLLFGFVDMLRRTAWVRELSKLVRSLMTRHRENVLAIRIFQSYSIASRNKRQHIISKKNVQAHICSVGRWQASEVNRAIQDYVIHFRGVETSHFVWRRTRRRRQSPIVNQPRSLKRTLPPLLR
jgi:hypothetical protein